MFDVWLRDHLVCPRDLSPLTETGTALCCAQGHSYPLVEGVPVLLLDEVEQTLAVAERTLAQARAGAVSPQEPLPKGSIDPYVQRAVADTNGMLYRGLRGRLSRYPIPELRLPPGRGQRLLDIGCNWGRWSLAAARRGYRPVGIDPSLEAILAARRVGRQLGLECSFLVADARYLPFAPASFEVVFSYSVLQHMSDASVGQALAGAARVLRPDGASLIQMANSYGLRSLYHQARRGFRPPRAFEVRYRTVAALRSMFASALGPPRFSVDGFFGLGIQPSDIDLMPPPFRIVITASELLRRASQRLPWLLHIADSVYIQTGTIYQST